MKLEYPLCKPGARGQKFDLIAALALALSGCGGGDDSAQTSVTFQGTLSGTECLTGLPINVAARFLVEIADFSSGSPVTLVDQGNLSWTGLMTSPSSFSVTTPADARMSIAASDVSAAGAHILATTACSSFRCCSTLTGDLRS